MDKSIKILTNEVPEYQRRKLAEGALKLMWQVFSMPGAEEKYQAWLKERRGEEVE